VSTLTCVSTERAARQDVRAILGMMAIGAMTACQTTTARHVCRACVTVECAIAHGVVTGLACVSPDSLGPDVMSVSLGVLDPTVRYAQRA
jgi:hypothetical protein